MARSTPRAKALTRGALRVSVQGCERVGPTMQRVTLGGPQLRSFVPMGYDQWFRLFLPTGPGSLDAVPAKLTRMTYLRLLALPEQKRPVVRNYTVRAVREQAGERVLDVDFVVHGSAADGTAGPASSWAEQASVGQEVVLLDEGTMFPHQRLHPETQVSLVVDETGLPALAGVLASLPRETRGTAIAEIPQAGDAQALDAPDGVTVTWVTRVRPGDTPGAAALATLQAAPPPVGPTLAWTAGESDLVTGARRHWVAAGVPKHDICFCGYWKAGASTD